MPDDVRNIAPQPGTVNTGISDTTIDKAGAALNAAAAGFHVFPIAPDAKAPPLIKAWETTATTDPARVEAWWRQWPDANIGWVPALSGMVFIDLDRKPGKPDGVAELRKIEAEHGELLPATMTVLTPSGGEHRVYYGAMPTSAGTIGPGIDIRGGKMIDGELASAGYGLLPPSTVAGKPYALAAPATVAELPAWFCKIARPKLKPAEAPANVTLDDPDTLDWAVDRIRAEIAAHGEPVIGEASDDRTFKLVCTLKDGDRYGYSLAQETAVALLAEHWAPADFTDDWIEAKVASAYRSQNAPGAGPPGCNERVFPGAVEWLTEYLAAHPGAEAEASARIEAMEQQTANQKQSTTSEEPIIFPRGHRGSALCTMAFGDMKWAWRNRIELGRPMILPGALGTGKTSLALGAAVASAAGVPYLGEPMQKMRWLVMLGEDTYRNARKILTGLCRDMGVAESVLDDIHVMSAIDDAIPGGPMLCRIAAGQQNTAAVRVEQSRYMTEAVLPQLDELRGDGAPVGWIIDPLDKFVEFDRNLPYVARAVADRWLEPLCHARPGLTPWINDHPSKAGERDGFGYAGAPGLVNAIPSFLALEFKRGKDRKPIVQEYEGIKQVSLEFLIRRVKEAPSAKIDLYRIGSSPLFSLRPADGLSLVSTMVRVYRAIEGRREKGERVRDDNRGGLAGPLVIAMELSADEALVREVMRMLVKVGIYNSKRATTSGHAPRDPGGLMLAGNYQGARIDVECLYYEMRRLGEWWKSQGKPVPWETVDLGAGSEDGEPVTIKAEADNSADLPPLW